MIFVRVDIYPCLYLNLCRTAFTAYQDFRIVRELASGLAGIEADGPFHQLFPVMVRQFRIEPFSGPEYALVRHLAPFFPEVTVHLPVHDFTLVLAPSVPHVVEEAGHCIYHLIIYFCYHIVFRFKSFHLYFRVEA